MSHTRGLYKLSRGIITKVLKATGEVPKCLGCGLELKEGDVIVSKQKLRKGSTHTRSRYHKKCAAKLGIWWS